MGSEYNPKKRYDITMSRRTRKPWKNLTDKSAAEVNLNGQQLNPPENSADDGKESAGNHTETSCTAEQKKDTQVSLKKLINTVQDPKPSQVSSSKSKSKGSRSSRINGTAAGKASATTPTTTSLSQHFKEDNPQRQLVVRKQDGQGHNSGVKLNRIMKRYIKSLFSRRE